jgi:tetratricopeptide (TPR) repeat protein
MNWSLRIARIGETEVKVHVSFILIVIYILWQFGLENLRGVLFAFLLLALLFACVLLHELGHTLVARRFGIPVRSIVLWPLGGFAMLSRLPDRPIHELLIAVAGPLVNAALVGLALLGMSGTNALAAPLFRWQPESLDAVIATRAILRYLVTANVSLALFNLIPAYPLDGGRMLRAGLTMLIGEQRAGPIVLWLSWALAIGLGVYGALERDWLLVSVAALVFLAAGTLHKRFEEVFQRVYGHLFERGLVAIEKGDYNRAITYYDQAIARNPKRAMSFNNRGVAYQHKKEYDQAIADYSRAIKLSPDFALALSNRRAVYFTIGDYQRALADADRLVQLQPHDALSFAVRGDCASFYGDDVRALADYAHALQLAPKNFALYVGRSALYIRSSNNVLALADCEYAIKLNPNAAPAYVNRGLIRLIQNDDSGALPDFERAIQLAPHLVQGFQNRGMIHHRARDYQRALQDYNQAITLDSHDPDAHGLRGEIYFRLGDSGRARENIDLALRYKPEAALVFDELWLTLYLKGRLEWALFYYDRAAQLRPDDPLVYQGRGDAYRVNGENELALIEYNRASELAPDRADAYLRRGRAYQALGDHDLAAADFGRVLELNAKPNVQRQAEMYMRELPAVVAA